LSSLSVWHMTWSLYGLPSTAKGIFGFVWFEMAFLCLLDYWEKENIPRKIHWVMRRACHWWCQWRHFLRKLLFVLPCSNGGAGQKYRKNGSMLYAFSLFFHSNCIFLGILSNKNYENLEEIKIYKIVTIYLNSNIHLKNIFVWSWIWHPPLK